MTVINTNVKSLVARDALTINNRQLSTAMERLSTGKRINSAADDAAGLSISTRMDSQVRGLQMAVKNSNDAISVTQTAEGAMQEINNILQRMRELAVQSSNDSNGAEDRAFLQAEVAQLSDEIDRIATTTQFNGINVLDGGFANKKFQIGANAGQTMSISIGDMRSSALGVASSEIQLNGVAPSSSSQYSEQVVVKATGTAATGTQASLLFGGTVSGAIGFKISDVATGLSATISTTLDTTSEYSKADFADTVNKTLRQLAQNTSVTGATASAAAVDISDSANWDDLKFSIQIGDGTSVKNVDIRQRLLSNGVTGSASSAQMATAMQQELRSLFSDDNQSITVTNPGSKLYKITDEEGRSISVTQGAGSGFFFGTDSDNSGALSADATIQTQISGAWVGDAFVLTDPTGGELRVGTFTGVAGRTMTFDASVGQEQQIDPIMFTSAAVSTIASSTNDEARFSGLVEETQMALTFSNRQGSSGASTATYAFKLTNGDGDVYANLTALDLYKTQTDAQIVAAVRTALASDLANLADNTIDISEFEIGFSGNTLTITNTAGRALAVEDFSSNVGSMTVTPLNELGAQQTLASKNALFSETRIGVNSQFFGMTAGPSATAFHLVIDGRTIGSTALAVSVNGTLNATGASWASAVQAAIRGGSATKMMVNGTQTSAYYDLSTISVDYDADAGELLITDSLGRAIGFGLHSTNPLIGTGAIFTQDFVTGEANDSNVVRVDSAVAQGDVYESTRVQLSLSADDATFNFKVNGKYLSVGPAGTTAVNVAYDATADFATSDLKADLDALMVTLNASHPDDVFQYAVSGRDITIWQRDGGEISISDFTTAGADDDNLTLTISGAPGQGNTVVAREHDLNTGSTAAAAVGTAASRTEATLTLSADDGYSIVINDGSQDYTLARTVVDLSDTTSVQNFANALETALSGSGISASMDTNGRVYLTRADGGEIGLKSFSSSTGASAVWTPKAGQGDQTTITANGSLTQRVLTSGQSVTASVGGGSVAVAQISVATQADAEVALSVVDDALQYVNSERSKLGAIENRLTHTIDNLTNVVTNTEAARSRIVDADYAAETSELARTQIIQQAATAMLAQANQSSQSVLSLLQ